MLTPKEEKILSLAERGGTDKDLLILEEISALEEKMGAMEEKHKEEMSGMKDMMMEMKTGIPKFGELIESIKTLAEKEIPQTIVNVPETKVEVKAPIVNVAAPNVVVEAKSIPAPIVNIKADGIAMPHPGIEELRGMMENMRTEMESKIAEKSKLTIFGPGKTRVILKDLSDQLDGSTKTFFIGTNFGIISVNGSSMPFGAFRPVTDYNESGKNIVFTSAVDASISLATGQSLIVKYLR